MFAIQSNFYDVLSNFHINTKHSSIRQIVSTFDFSDPRQKYEGAKSGKLCGQVICYVGWLPNHFYLFLFVKCTQNRSYFALLLKLKAHIATNKSTIVKLVKQKIKVFTSK